MYTHSKNRVIVLSLPSAKQRGLVAQSVEQRIENPCVGGSIPPKATKDIKHLAQSNDWAFCFFWQISGSLFDYAFRRLTV